MILAYLGAVLSLIGSLFLLLTSVGILRMPDTYTRMLSATKASTLGTAMFLIGIGIAMPEWIIRLILLVFAVIVTNPLSAHIIARTAYYLGIPLSHQTVKNDLQSKE